METYARKRCANPGEYYGTAEEVLKDEGLTVTEKEYILKSMAFEAEVLDDAEEDFRYSGEHPADVTAIHKALNELGQESSLDGRAADTVQAYIDSKKIFSSIVSAVSGKTDLDRKVIEMTTAVARLSRGEVTFVSVVPPSPDPAHYGAFAPMACGLEFRPETQDALESRMDARRMNVRDVLDKSTVTPSPFHLEVRNGQPNDEILRAAEERLADLIIVGSHERSWIESLFASETAQQVANVSECPVLIVPEQAKD